MLPKTRPDREQDKFKWTPQRTAVKVAIVEDSSGLTLDLAFKMLSNSSSVDLSSANSVSVSMTGNVSTVSFFDVDENLIAALSYDGNSASWSGIQDTLLLEGVGSLLLESGAPFLLEV
jgi:hypothetical protein